MATTKLYLIVSPNYDRTKLKELLDTHPDVSDWFFNMRDTLFIKSTLSAKQIGSYILSKFGKERFFVTEVTTNYWGAMPTDHWEKFK